MSVKMYHALEETLHAILCNFFPMNGLPSLLKTFYRKIPVSFIITCHIYQYTTSNGAF